MRLSFFIKFGYSVKLEETEIGKGRCFQWEIFNWGIIGKIIRIIIAD